MPEQGDDRLDQGAGIHGTDPDSRLGITRFDQTHLDGCRPHANQDIAAGGLVVDKRFLHADLGKEIVHIRHFFRRAAQHRDPHDRDQYLRELIPILRQIAAEKVGSARRAAAQEEKRDGTLGHVSGQGR